VKSRPPPFRTRALLVAAGLAFALGATAPAQVPAPVRCGFLFIVDTSSAMSRLSDSAQLTLASLVASGLHGEMRPGEEFTVWTFNEDLNARGLPVITWSPENSGSVAARAAQHLKSQKFRRASRMDRLVPEVLAAMRATELLVAVIISDGEQVVVGTPFDRKINVTYGTRAEEMRRVKKPFVTALAARRGQIVDFAVTLGDEPIELSGFRQVLAKAGAPGSELAPFAPPTSVPVLMKPGAAPVAATNVLSVPSPTNRPSAAVVASAPPPAPTKTAPAVQAPSPVPAVATPSPAPAKAVEPPKREPPPPAVAPNETPPPPAPPKETKSVAAAPPAANPIPPPIPPSAAAKVQPVAEPTVKSAPPETPATASKAPTATSPAPPRVTNPAPEPVQPATSRPVLITNLPPVAATKSAEVNPSAPPKVVAANPPVTSSSQVIEAPSNPPSSAPAQPTAAVVTPHVAVATPASRRGNSWLLAAGSVALLVAGFWVILPWFRRPEPERATSLISRSMDDQRRK